MPASTAQTGKGTTLSYCTTSNGTFIKLGELYSVDHPRVKVPSVDATNYESPSNTTEKKSTNWKEYEPIKGELSYAKALTITLYSLVDTPLYWKEVLSDGGTWSYYGWISDYGAAGIPNKDIIKQQIEITTSGVITFA